jgi:hypothetical protein
MRVAGVMAAGGVVAVVAVGAIAWSRDHGGVVSYQGYRGTAIVSTDGRTLIVGPYGLVCGATVTAVARESRARVALFVRQETGGPGCAPGEGAMAQVPAQRIRLRAPLGRRELVDGSTGTATPWISARLILRPRLVPAGYRSGGLMPWMSSALNPSGARSAACMQIYQVGRDGPDEFLIIQSTGGLQLQHRGAWTPIRVRGHSGRASAGEIIWRERGLTDLIAASPALPVAQLVAIANSGGGYPAAPGTATAGSRH